MDKLLLSITEAAAQLGLGRSKMYQLIGEGLIPVVRIGRSVRISSKALEDLVARLQEEAMEDQSGEGSHGRGGLPSA